MTQWFGPTELRITFETEGLGKFTPEEVDNVAIRDGTGRITALRLPRKAVIISNHQVRRFSFTGSFRLTLLSGAGLR
jgi:hypothetical protein